MSAFLNQHGDCGFYAKLLLDRINIREIPVDPLKVADKMGIPVIEKEAENRFDGFLLNVDGEMAVVINSSITYKPRKNFTIAHEIGHAEIPHHKGLEYRCLKEDIVSSLVKRQCEREANEFAAELIMPASFVSEQAEENEIGLEVIKSISGKCEASLTSSALRYIKYCPEIALIVISENNIIKYFSLSEEANKRKLFLSSGATLNKLSIAYDFFDKNGVVVNNNEDRQQVDISAWFPELDYSQYDCFENTIALPSFDQVISLVWLIDKRDDEEEDEP